MGKLLRWTAITIVSLLFFVVLGIGAFLLFGIPVELSGFRAPVEKAASLAIGRPVTIDGSVSLAPSLEPTLQIEGVHIANDDGWSDPDLFVLGLARVQLAVMPLLQGRLEIAEVAIDSLEVNLETSAHGARNWLVDVPDRKPAKPDEPADTVPSRGLALDTFEIEELNLKDLSVTFRDGVDGKTYELALSSITGSAVDKQPMRLAIEGSAQQVPYTITLTAGSLETLLRGGEAWQVELGKMDTCSS